MAGLSHFFLKSKNTAPFFSLQMFHRVAKKPEFELLLILILETEGNNRVIDRCLAHC